MHLARRFSSSAPFALLIVLASSCGGGGDGGVGPDPRPAGVTIVAGSGASDTVLATLGAPLEVEVRDARGGVVSGASVRFQALRPAGPLRFGRDAIYVCGISQPRCSESSPDEYPRDLIVTTTNGKGRAAVGVRLGNVAGPATIEVSVPALGFADTARFTVRPGAGIDVRFAVPDTAVYVGASYSIGATAVDRYDNPRGDALTFAALDDAASANSQGVVTAATIGRARVVARFGTAAETSSVSVVPHGAFAAYRQGGSASDPSGVVTSSLDGSGFRFISATETASGVFPVISPRTGEILFHDRAGAPRLAIVDPLGTTRRDFAASAPAVTTSQYGRFSTDGSTASFVCYPDTGGTNRFAMCRASADGTGVTQLVTLPRGVFLDVEPMLSPDGARVAYGTGGGTIEFVSVPSGQVSGLSVNGNFPRWSPTGDRISFTTLQGGAVKVMNADGSGLRTLTTSGAYAAAPEWSADGEWLLVRGAATLDLVRVADGLTLPLPFTGRYYQASWRP